MATTYSAAPDVERIGRNLIQKHHRHLLLQGVRVDFVFRSDTPKKNGREVWGTARKVSSLAAYLAGNEDLEGDVNGAAMFVVTISWPIWQIITEEQKVALVDHELCHLWAEMEQDDNGDEKLILSILGHDLEEFRAIVARHGMWKGDVQQFADAVKALQPALQI
jgi:hypothetical protein